MERYLRKIFTLLLLGLIASGCGRGGDLAQVSPPDPGSTVGPTDRVLIEQAQVSDPSSALRLIPTDHLDPLTRISEAVSPQLSSPSRFISVEDLQTNYDILFGSLSEQFGVTLSTPEVVANIDFIKAQEATANFDLLAQPISNNPQGVTGVGFQAVNYQTTAPLPKGEQSFAVSGGLLIPLGISKEQLQGVIVYFHGTTFSKAQVGSNPDNPETNLCAQVFASQGYIVAIPDYVGQGVNWADVHPYVLYPRVSAQAAVDMLSAIRPILSQAFSLDEDDPPLKLFSAGYSEGGAYSLWFNSYLSAGEGTLDPLYALIHSVGMEGAYSTSEVTYDYLFDNVSPDDGNPFFIQTLGLVNIVKPTLSADAFLSYATYSLDSSYLEVFNQSFFEMRATPPVPQTDCNVDGEQVSIPEAFARPDTDISSQLVAAGLGKSGNGSRYPGPLALIDSSENAIVSLVSSTILEPENLAELQEVLKAADVDLSSCQDQGVSIITLDQDSVVVPNNFHLLNSKFPSKIWQAIEIDHTQLQHVSPFSSVLGRAYWVPIDHLQAPVFQFLYALNIFNSQQ